MTNVLEHITDWLFRPSGLPNIGHVTQAMLLTWPLDNGGYDGSPDYVYTGQLTRPTMSVLAGLDDATVQYDYLYYLSIPQVSADDEGSIAFDGGLNLTSPEPNLGWWLPGTLQSDNPINPGGVPVYPTTGQRGQVVTLDFCAVFAVEPPLLGGGNMPCKLILTTSSLYIVPPTKGTPINR